MKIQNNDTKDEGLKGNEKIEEAISALQQEVSQELLAHTLTVIRRRMKEEGQLILAVEPSVAEELKIQAVKTADGKIEGFILNPWNRTIMLDKTLLRLILGESGK